MVLGVLRGRGELGRGPGNKGWVGGAGSVSLLIGLPFPLPRSACTAAFIFYVKGDLGNG